MTTRSYTDALNRPAGQEGVSGRLWWMALAKVVAGFIPLFAVLQFGPLLLLPRLQPALARRDPGIRRRGPGGWVFNAVLQERTPAWRCDGSDMAGRGGGPYPWP